MTGGRVRIAFADRFWGKVPLRPLDPKACWEWQGHRNLKGYGRFNLGAAGGNATDVAHRVAFRLTTGPIPEGLFVLHRCDNPPCVRPSHLYAGTAHDNTWDMVRRGRARNNAEATALKTRGDNHWTRRRKRAMEAAGLPIKWQGCVGHKGEPRMLRGVHVERGTDHAPRLSARREAMA